jgi:hypothetical protein
MDMSTSAETDLQPSDDSNGVPATSGRNGKTNGMNPAEGMPTAHDGKTLVGAVTDLPDGPDEHDGVRPAEGMPTAHVEHGGTQD